MDLCTSIQYELRFAAIIKWLNGVLEAVPKKSNGVHILYEFRNQNSFVDELSISMQELMDVWPELDLFAVLDKQKHTGKTLQDRHKHMVRFRDTLQHGFNMGHGYITKSFFPRQGTLGCGVSVTW